MTPAHQLRSQLGFVLLGALNVALGVAFATAPTARVTIVALLPALFVAAAALIASNRAILIFGAFALDLSGILPLRGPVIGSSVFASDLILALALASWLAAWLIASAGRRPSWPRTPILGWPLLVFAIFIGSGIVRGHERWGLSYFSQPLRFVLYAGIAAAIADLKPRQAWNGLTVVFYLGAISTAIAAVFYMATGTVQDKAASGELATGNIRILTLTTALYLTGAFLLALLNLERAQRTRVRLLHLMVGILAGFGIVISYGRGVFYSLAVVIVVLCLTRSRLRNVALLAVPILLTAVVLGSLFTGSTPGFARGVTKRVTTTNDPSIQWRRAANSAIWQQVREDPILGVGFGKGADFTVSFTRFHITQDPHNSYLFLWAGGGILTLGSFILIFLIFLWDSWKRYRPQAELPRALIVWCVSVWFCFALNTLVEPQLTQSNSMLVLWILMLLPAIVPYCQTEERHGLNG